MVIYGLKVVVPAVAHGIAQITTFTPRSVVSEGFFCFARSVVRRALRACIRIVIVLRMAVLANEVSAAIGGVSFSSTFSLATLATWLTGCAVSKHLKTIADKVNVVMMASGERLQVRPFSYEHPDCHRDLLIGFSLPSRFVLSI